MGINISGDNFVAHDQTHEKRVNTSLDANPTSKKLGGVTVHHVFRRNKTGDLDRDGNPLIYALKGMPSTSWPRPRRSPRIRTTRAG